MALNEGGMPYALRVMCDGMLETIGRSSFEGALKSNFTAHPKQDPSNGKLYAFSYKVDMNVLKRRHRFCSCDRLRKTARILCVVPRVRCV